MTAVSTARARRTVTASVIVTGALVGIKDVSNGHAPTVKFALGLVASGVFLGFMADAAPGVASGFALLMLVGVLTTTGTDVFHKIKQGVS